MLLQNLVRVARGIGKREDIITVLYVLFGAGNRTQRGLVVVSSVCGVSGDEERNGERGMEGRKRERNRRSVYKKL